LAIAGGGNRVQPQAINNGVKGYARCGVLLIAANDPGTAATRDKRRRCLARQPDSAQEISKP